MYLNVSTSAGSSRRATNQLYISSSITTTIGGKASHSDPIQVSICLPPQASCFTPGYLYALSVGTAPPRHADSDVTRLLPGLFLPTPTLPQAVTLV